MIYFEKLKNLTKQFLIVFTIFIIMYTSLSYLTSQEVRYDSIIMVITCSFLISLTRVMVKEENEKNQEFIRSNYWKLKNELKKRNNRRGKK